MTRTRTSVFVPWVGDILRNFDNHRRPVHLKSVSSFYPIDEQLVDAIFLTDADDARVLLSQNADPDARDGEHRTVLSIAVADGSKELVLLLLEAGADPNLADADGLSPLDVAIYRRRLDLAWLLVQFGAGSKGTLSETTLWRANLVGSADPGIPALLNREHVRNAESARN